MSLQGCGWVSHLVDALDAWIQVRQKQMFPPGLSRPMVLGDACTKLVPPHSSLWTCTTLRYGNVVEKYGPRHKIASSFHDLPGPASFPVAHHPAWAGLTKAAGHTLGNSNSVIVSEPLAQRQSSHKHFLDNSQKIRL